jgi:tetratricopeptide (TPR) repeat protein
MRHASTARLAGERAMGMCAYEEAAVQYQRALHALKFAGPDEPVRCELLLRLGAAQARAGNYQQAKESCLRAAEISRTPGAPEQLARAALGFGEPQVEGGLVNRQLVGLLQEALDALGPQDSPLRGGCWLPAVALASVLSAYLEEPEAAGSLYPVLLPYAGHIVAFTAPSRSSAWDRRRSTWACWRPVTSRWAQAADHFEAAVRAHDRLGARPFLARTGYHYARMLLARGQTADRSRAVELLDRALATADTLGIVAVAEGIRALQAAQAGSMVSAEPAAAAAAAEVSRNLFRREGEYWTVCYQGSVVRLKDAKGLRHLARLLAHPGREFYAADLEAAEGQAAPAAPVGPRGSG